MAATKLPRRRSAAAVADPAPVQVIEVRPQPGPQELILSTPADIGIIGGAVFGGKTWALLYEALRHVTVEGFTFVAFRREMPEVTNPGGMWDESLKWYPMAGGVPREHTREWFFEKNGAQTGHGKFAGLQHEKDKESWKGAQVCLFLFDQLEMFSEDTFFYMLSRNRSTCGVRPYVRASCNPDPDCFLATFIAWWIDDEGWAIPSRSGVIRWFIRIGETITWASTACPPARYAYYADYEAEAKAELETKAPGDGKFAKSVTFVLARLQDNVIGNTLNPEYEGNVRALSLVERTRLLGGDRGGNWKIRPTAGTVFNRAHFRTCKELPSADQMLSIVRYWDKAGTQDGGKWTAGCLMVKTRDGRYVIADIERGQWSSGNRERVILQKAHADKAQFGDAVTIWIEQEPGSGGKESAENTIINLGGFIIKAERPTGEKIVRASPLAAQTEPPAQNVYLLEADWNEEFLREAHRFDGVHGVMDQIDAAAGAFNKLKLGPGPVKQVPIKLG
jgi:predicted phage terminase large subunit-like protein